MIADLKPYPAYKDSGSQWIAQVPEHWEVRNLRTVIRPRNERNRVDLPLLSVARERGVFVRSMTDASENHNIIPLDLSNYKVARAGSLVINKMKAWQGSMGIAPCDGIVSPAYYVYDFAIADRKFGQALLRSKPYVAHFGQASDGVRVGQWDLTIAAMRQIPVLAPPPEEQAAIVKFLDWANARLERTIRAKRRVIALLTEQKHAIIHRAVTRGLDSNVSLKPSGIAWLGDIPAHWAIRRLKTVTEDIVDCLHSTPTYIDSGNHPAIRTADIAPGVVHIGKAKKISSADYVLWTARLEPQEGDILYSREGERFGIAALVPAGERLCISQRMMVFRIAMGFSSSFVMWLLNSKPTYQQALQDVMGSTAPHVNISTIKNYVLAMPDKLEQEKIAHHIERETVALDLVMSRLNREIDLLLEYRTRLIADIVTGKLDVRQAAARLRQGEAEDLEPDALDTLEAADADAEAELEE